MLHTIGFVVAFCLAWTGIAVLWCYAPTDLRWAGFLQGYAKRAGDYNQPLGLS